MPKTRNQKLVIRYAQRILGRNSIFNPYPRSPIQGLRGFTLVELLVVLAIISILTFITLGSFNNFQRNQEVRNAAEKLKSDLRKYQNLATSGQKNPTNLPFNSGCNPPVTNPGDQAFTMINYTVRVNLTAAPRQYQAEITCGDPVAPTVVRLPLVQLPDGYNYNSTCGGNPILIFLPLSRQVSTPCNIRINRGTSTYTVHVTQAGSIFNE